MVMKNCFQGRLEDDIVGKEINFYNYFENASDSELRTYYRQYKEFQQTGVIPEGCELRKAADEYIGRLAWTVPFMNDLLCTIADRWMEEMV